jgi:hypothetical protein
MLNDLHNSELEKNYFSYECKTHTISILMHPLKNGRILKGLQTLPDWLFTVLRPLKNFSLIWRRHHCWWRAAKFRPILGTQGLWAGRDLYRATPTVTRDLSFPGLIRRNAPYSRLLRHTRGCGGSILTRILTGNIAWDLYVIVCILLFFFSHSYTSNTAKENRSWGQSF